MDIELDVLSLVLIGIISVLLVVPILFPTDPDTFPFILNNQSQPSKVRHPGESPLYRHRDQPHGYPLISGLSLRKGYEAPRDGDLRDVWEIALEKNVTLGIVRGGKCEFEKLAGRQEELERLGNGLRKLAGEGGKVAIYMPNTIENLLTNFACAFQGLTGVILPFTTPSQSPPTIPEDVIDMLKVAKPQVLVLPAGLALQDIKGVKSIKGIVVVDIGSAPHMDWSDGSKSHSVQTWSDMLESAGAQHEEPAKPATIAFQSVVEAGSTYKTVDFTQQNVIAAVASQLKLLPKEHVLSEKDVVLPLAPFSDTLSRTLTFAAMASGISNRMYVTSGSTLLLHPFTDPLAQINISKQLHPTIVVVNNAVTSILTQEAMGWRRESTVKSIQLTLNSNKLANGRLPNGLKEVRSAISNKLRLLYISFQPDTHPVYSHALELLRASLGSHIIYALGSPWAFGPIAQTHLHDYRHDTMGMSGFGHFGAPVGGVEIKLTGVSDEGSIHDKVGTVEINGPVVVGKEWVSTGVKSKWRRDGCLEVQF